MSLKLDPRLAGMIAADDGLWRDFNDICDCGGRLAGTPSERKAFALLRERVRAASLANSGRSIPVPYNGWQARRATLRLADGAMAACHPLGAHDRHGEGRADRRGGRSRPRHARGIRRTRGRHQGPHRAGAPRADVRRGTIHRRRKYDMARASGAVGFPDRGPAQRPCRGGLIGPRQRRRPPGFGIAPETAARLARRPDGWPSVTMTIETDEAPAETETLVYEYPGTTDDWVVLSAHVDGHDLAESAMDNGTGLAAVLAVTRALAPEVARWRRGLRVMFFQRRGMGADRLGAVRASALGGRARQDRASTSISTRSQAAPTSRR
jgi:hypothetical protein